MTNLFFLESILKMPLMALPVRSTVVKLKNATVLISPGSKLTEAQLTSLSSVTDLVAPNLFHLAGVPVATKVFSKAKVWCVQGTQEKRSDLGEFNVLTEQSWPFQNELAMVCIHGMPKFNEVVFVHKESKSLIVTDLCFNLIEARGIGAWIILNLFGTYRRIAVSKLFVKYIVDKEAFKKSIDQLLTYDFENIIVGHGSIIKGNGKALLTKALIDRGLIKP